MKKFYTVTTQQVLKKQYYGDENGILYDNCKEPVYSSLIVTLKNVIHNESFKVYVLDSFHSDKSDYNLSLLIEELDIYFKDLYTLETVDTSMLSDSKGQLKIFKKIYETLQPGDEIYFDITFGYRPMPMIAIAACNYAYKFIEDVMIRKIFYTMYDFEHPEDVHKVIDVTSLFYIEQFMAKTPASKGHDPFELLDKLFIE